MTFFDILLLFLPSLPFLLLAVDVFLDFLDGKVVGGLESTNTRTGHFGHLLVFHVLKVFHREHGTLLGGKTGYRGLKQLHRPVTVKVAVALQCVQNARGAFFVEIVGAVYGNSVVLFAEECERLVIGYLV